MMRPPSRPGVRTPTSAVLVQALFVLGVVGTGVTSALAVWLGGKKPKVEEARDERPRD